MKKIIDMLKSMTNSKKKVFALALSVCVVVLSIASSSIAYFTDTAKFTNTFTSGNVKIQLSEATVVKDANTGNIVEKTGASRIVATKETPQTQEFGSVFPKQTIVKDPTIENLGSETAYVGAIITITSDEMLSVLSATSGVVGKTYIGDFLVGLTTSGATVKVKEITNGFEIYVVFETALANKDAVSGKTAVIFTGIKIPDAWNNAEMEDINNLKIIVDAYAVQTAGMTNGALKALQDGFDGAFDNIPTT